MRYTMVGMVNEGEAAPSKVMFRDAVPLGRPNFTDLLPYPTDEKGNRNPQLAVKGYKQIEGHETAAGNRTDVEERARKTNG